MALHTTLPIHKLTYDLLGLAVELVRNMPRDIKVSLGAEIRGECVRMLTLIGRANAAADKVPHLTALLEAHETIELLLRTCRDKKFISSGQWAKATELLSSVGAQAGGWRKQSALVNASQPRTNAPSAQGSLFSSNSAASPAA